MSRYIDADALIDNLELMYEHRDDKDEPYNIGVRGAINMTRNAPTIEPKRGEWKPFDLTWGRSIWYCTACEESTEVPCDIWEHKPIYKYCPNCGADMREREGE